MTRPRRARRRGRTAAWIVLLLLVLAVTSVGWVGVRGALAYRHLRHLEAAAPGLQQALVDGDTAQASSLGAGVRANAAAADRLTGDPVWQAAGHLPVLGRDLAATHALAHAVDGLAADALPPLARVAAMVADRPAAGTGSPLPADLTLLRAANGDVGTAQSAVTTAGAQLGAIDTTGLRPQVAQAVTTVRTRVGQVSGPLDTASRAAGVLPAMLDPATPKTYLLLFQNLAEARSLGGIVGAYAVVRADSGHLSLIAQGSGASIKEFPQPVLRIDPGYGSLFADQPARYFLDTTTAPYFPDTAALAREMWRRHSGQTVDGVLSVDPVALSYLLAATGPVTVPGGPTVDSANAARILLHDVYAEYPDPAVQDAVFARTAAVVFAAVTSYHGAPRPLLTALTRAVTERRLLVWSADPVVARSLAGTAVAGVPATAQDGGARNVGIYLNEGDASKLSWYLSSEVSLHDSGLAGGHRSVQARIDLHSNAPAGGRGLPPYVLGTSQHGSDHIVVLVLAPAHAAVVSATVDGRPVAIGTAELHGRRAVSFALDLPAGGHAQADVSLLVTGTPGLDLQPLAH